MSIFSMKALNAGFVANLSPQAKLLLWAGVIAAFGVVVQTGAWLVGSDFSLLSASGGRGVLLAAAVASLLFMMASDRRSAAEYGLAVNGNWMKECRRGFGLGVVCYAAYCVVTLLLGGYSLYTQDVNAHRCISGLVAAAAAGPVAATQQVIFSGYLLSTLRDRYSRVTSVLISSLLFGVLTGATAPEFLAPWNVRLMTGMFAIAAFLAVLRLRYGNIILPSSLLAGCIVVRRIVRKTHLLAPGGQAAWQFWLAPTGDPRQSPVLWAIVLLAMCVSWRLLRRDGEPRIEADQPALSASFKRVFPFSNVLAMAPLDLWILRLIDARFRVGWKYVPRLLTVLTISAVNTVLSLPERLLLPLLLRHPVPDPVFIVGVHRSGTTHLHNLLSKDQRFCTPRNFHTLNPIGLLFSGWLITPILGAFLTMRRPMDAMRINVLSPQEDEFALASMSRCSPYWGATFPHRIAHYDRYIFPDQFSESELRGWQRNLVLFLRKLTFWSRKRPLLKSPYHTGRVAALREIFPRAKFIHIVRHPHAVYRSNMHMARQGWIVFQLQDPNPQDCYANRFLQNYRALEDAFYRDIGDVPAHDVAEVRLEDLEQDPLAEIRRIYGELELEYSVELQRKLTSYLANVADYRKNRLPELEPEERREVDAVMQPLLTRWGYETPTPRQAADAA